MAKIGNHSIVLGASMAGLLAARALSDFFDTVTVVERDMLPDDPVNRRGVPQGRHPHGLLARCALALEELFPRAAISMTLVCAGNAAGRSTLRCVDGRENLGRPDRDLCRGPAHGLSERWFAWQRRTFDGGLGVSPCPN